MHLNQIVIIYITILLQTRCDEMKAEGWTIDVDGKLQLIEFDEDEITLELPVDDPVMDTDKNWMLVPRIFPLVS